ncbi:MAG TPA: hypothetical protein VEG38_20225, partial [Acidimicrobiia bacterium]|nr:hypothetical protein [Acidimicrobiia bacterium]
MRLVVALVAAMTFWTTPAPATAAASATADDGTWGTEIADTGRAGRVLTVLANGGMVYLGGSFRHMSPPGSKSEADLVPRDHLAALGNGGTTLAEWDPGADKEVRALLASADGRRIYAGGMFSRIGKQRASRLAALDAITGALDPTFTPPKFDAVVRALALSPDGSVLYVGGDFSQLVDADGSVSTRPHLAALDAATGA